MPRVTSAALAVTWLPLLVLTLIEGTAFGDSVAVAFLRDHIANGRSSTVRRSRLPGYERLG